MTKFALWVHVLVALAVFAQPVLAQSDSEEPRDGELKLSTERVIIFKDGYALFAKKGTAVVRADGTVFTEQVPDSAVLGSFWARSDKNPIASMRAGWEETSEIRSEVTDCITVLELLRANLGRKVTLVLSPGEETENLSGTIADVLDLPPAENSGRTQLWEPSMHGRSVHVQPQAIPAAGETVRPLVPRGGQLVVLDTRDGRLVLPVSQIQRVAGSKLVTTMSRQLEVKTRTKRLTMDLGKKAANKRVEVNLIYFAEGVRWIPTYRVDVGKKNKAQIALQGELLNEAEDFEDAAIDLVVGVPNFRFKSVISPLSMERTMRSALATAAPGLMGNDNSNYFSNASFTQRSSELRTPASSGGAAGSSPLDMAPELRAESQADLFIYSVDSLSVKKGARATVALWQSEVPSRDIYTLDIQGGRNTSPRVASAGRTIHGSPLRLQKNEVWHQLELSDNTRVPWTTGAALVLDGPLPLGQELLAYTPIGGKTLLPITVAIDVRGDYSESELKRQPNALKWDRYHYTRIDKKGSVMLHNYRKESAVVHVQVKAPGAAKKATAGGKVARGGSSGVNAASVVTWEITLKPGESRTLSYEYAHYVR